MKGCKMKRIGVVFLSMLIMLIFCSCAFSRERQLNSLMSEESEKIQEESDEIIRCLTEGDKEGFEALFAEEVRERDAFHREVDTLFEFFECDVYIKSEIDTSASGGDSIRSGKKTAWYVTPEIVYIKTLVDREDGAYPAESRYYNVNYYWQITDEEEPAAEGIHYLDMSLINIEGTVRVGTDEFVAHRRQT